MFSDKEEKVNATQYQADSKAPGLKSLKEVISVYCGI